MVECLSFHAKYRCRHSGACCSTAWNLPFTDEERHRVERLELVSTPFVPGPERGVSFATRRPDGACVFLDTDAHRCMVHRAAGQDALAVTCRMFPRIVRHDAVSTRLSLSHYCPTAAGLLFEDEDDEARIVEAPESLVDVGELDGLDARDELPPLLRPDVLMDVESYRAWESQGVRIMTSPGAAPREAIDRLAAITRQIVVWAPGSGELMNTVEKSCRAYLPFSVAPASHRRTVDVAAGRWLAARLFGNWIAYQSRGLETIVAYLRHCADVLEQELARDRYPLEAFRRADYRIVHEADSQELARLLERERHQRPGGVLPARDGDLH